jgi:hypothetical protein
VRSSFGVAAVARNFKRISSRRHHNGLSGDEGGIVGREEGKRSGEVFRCFSSRESPAAIISKIFQSASAAVKRRLRNPAEEGVKKFGGWLGMAFCTALI